MYFFAAWPALWMVVSFMMDKLFAFIEWWFYREALFYLDSVRRTARGLIFMCLVRPGDRRNTAPHGQCASRAGSSRLNLKHSKMELEVLQVFGCIMGCHVSCAQVHAWDIDYVLAVLAAADPALVRGLLLGSVVWRQQL